MNDTENTKKTPAFNVFAKQLNQDGTSKIASQLGVAWQHNEGGGYNIVLDASPIPVNGKIELIMFPNKG